MNLDETKKILNYVNGFYPNFLNSRNPEVVEFVWNDILKECDYNQVQARLRNWCKVEKFPPLPAQLVPPVMHYETHE